MGFLVGVVGFLVICGGGHLFARVIGPFLAALPAPLAPVDNCVVIKSPAG
jgi:hypothetical protein